MTENSAIPLRQRNIGHVYAESGGMVSVDHVFAGEGAFECGHCGKPGHDPGFVGLLVDDDPEDDESGVAIVSLTAEEALTLANRLTRAANLVLESEEGAPDVEREAARYMVPDDASGAEATAAQPETDPVRKAVWAAWHETPDDHPSPVKRIARQLGMKAADVAEILYPADQFGQWSAEQEPDLPDNAAGAEQ